MCGLTLSFVFGEFAIYRFTNYLIAPKFGFIWRNYAPSQGLHLEDGEWEICRHLSHKNEKRQKGAENTLGTKRKAGKSSEILKSWF